MSPIHYQIKLLFIIWNTKFFTRLNKIKKKALSFNHNHSFIHSFIQVWTILENMLQAAEPRRADSLQPSTEDDGPAQKKRRSELLLGSDSDSEDGIESGELQRYRAEPSISIDDCPLQWWYAHSGVYEKLSVLAQKYLASPATSVPCERLFSLAGHIVQKKRAALLPENVTRLVCLSDWLRKKK